MSTCRSCGDHITRSTGCMSTGKPGSVRTWTPMAQTRAAAGRIVASLRTHSSFLSWLIASTSPCPSSEKSML